MLSLLMGLSGASAHAVGVTPSTDANALANLLIGPGITLVPASATLTSGTTSAGSFSGGTAADIGINQGLLLTSGSVYNAPGPNNDDGASAQASGSGTSLLSDSTDSTVLKFDFTSAGGDLFFNYVFGSEEYNEFVNSSYNDVFGFFLDGVNIALIPGTSTEVSINNLNNGLNSAYYVNNDLSDLPAASLKNIQYDGFTVVLQAKALGLSAGTHTIELAIADRGDQILDSGVFIQGGSFSDTPQPPSVPDGGATMGLMSVALLGMAGARRFIR